MNGETSILRHLLGYTPTWEKRGSFKLNRVRRYLKSALEGAILAHQHESMAILIEHLQKLWIQEDGLLKYYAPLVELSATSGNIEAFRTISAMKGYESPIGVEAFQDACAMGHANFVQYILDNGLFHLHLIENSSALRLPAKHPGSVIAQVLVEYGIHTFFGLSLDTKEDEPSSIGPEDEHNLFPQWMF